MTEKGKRFEMRFSNNFFKEVKKKAGLIPIAAIIRRLLEKWLKGDVDLD